MSEELFENCIKEGGIAIELDQYAMRVSSVFNLSDINGDSSHQGIFRKSRRKESSIDFGNIFKSACDELKQHQATHTKARVMTLT